MRGGVRDENQGIRLRPLPLRQRAAVFGIEILLQQKRGTRACFIFFSVNGVVHGELGHFDAVLPG